MNEKTILLGHQACPCGSGRRYLECCQPLHSGGRADSPEALMRSRFVAYKAGLIPYLLASWHPDTRPASLDLSRAPQWGGLDILDSGEERGKGWVSFKAYYREGDEWCYLAENSRFLKSGEHWRYLDGETEEGVLKPGRNHHCPCGSGRKYKACCLA